MAARTTEPDGFTLIEVVIAMVVISAVILGVGFTIFSVHGAGAKLEGEQIVFAQAETILDTLMSIRFGRPTEGPATDAQMIELLDSDTFPGDVSLHQVKQRCPADFQLDGFPVPGDWRLTIDTDLNEDGDMAGPAEGRPDIFRITVFHDGVRIVSILRRGGYVVEEPGETNPLYTALPTGDVTPSATDVFRGTTTDVQHVGFMGLFSGLWADAEQPANPGYPDVGAVR
jgi:prepilin-type N-terminal cleavage/methylation domain-containing protein